MFQMEPLRECYTRDLVQPDLVEVVDLPPGLQRVLWEEVAAAAAAVRHLPGVQKLNIAAIGASRASSFDTDAHAHRKLQCRHSNCCAPQGTSAASCMCM